MSIVGIFGKAGSGKDTIANYMIENLGYTKIAFADVLKDIVSVLFSWERHLLEGDTKESREFRETKDMWWSNKLGKEITPRLMLQQIGTDLFRNHFDKNIWLHVIERKIRKYDKVVISDIRFPNEHQLIKDLNGIIIKVERNIDNKVPYHSSENNFDNFSFNFYINNNNSINDLHSKIEHFLLNK